MFALGQVREYSTILRMQGCLREQGIAERLELRGIGRARCLHDTDGGFVAAGFDGEDTHVGKTTIRRVDSRDIL